MGWQEDLEQGVAARLATASVGVWDPTGATGTLELGPLSDDVDTGIGIQSYRLGQDDPQSPTTTVNVQLWCRGADRATVTALDQAAYDALHGLTDVWFGTVHVTQAYSKSSMPMGVDDRGRSERASNYTFELDLPATALRSYH